MNALSAIFLNTLLMVFGVTLLEGIYAESIESAVAVALAIGLANGLMKSVLQQSRPRVTIYQWFAFLLIMNGTLLVGLELFLPTFHINGFFWFFSFSFMLSLFNLLISEFELLHINNNV